MSQFHTLIRRHVFARSPLASSFCRASAWQRLTLTRFVSLTTSIFTAPRWASRLSCQSTCSAPVYLSTNLAVIRPLPTSARRKGGGGCTPSWQRRQGGAWRRGFPAARSSPATHLASAARLRRERRGRQLRKRLAASAHDAGSRGRALHATPAFAVAGALASAASSSALPRDLPLRSPPNAPLSHSRISCPPPKTKQPGNPVCTSRARALKNPCVVVVYRPPIPPLGCLFSFFLPVPFYPSPGRGVRFIYLLQLSQLEL